MHEPTDPRRSHVRVFVNDDAEGLDKQINDEIGSGHYRISAVSLVCHPASGQLIALVAFDPPSVP